MFCFWKWFVKLNQNFSNISTLGFNAANILASGTVQATYFVGDGTQLTGIATGNIQPLFARVGKISWAQNASALEKLLEQQTINYILLSQAEYGSLPEKVKRDYSALPGYQPTPLELQLLKRHLH